MTLTDAQFDVASEPRGTILRPFDDFEATYQGQAGDVPIAFPGVLDPEAGKPGFSPYLLKGVPCQEGSKVLLWFPSITEQTTSGLDTVEVDYAYTIFWRLRGAADQAKDFEENRNVPRSFHLPIRARGADDTLLSPATAANPNAGQRWVIPACAESVVFEQAEPTGTFLTSQQGKGTGNLRTQQIALPGDGAASASTFGLPLLPPGAPAFAGSFAGGTTPLGALQQGVYDPTLYDLAPYAGARPYFTIAKGDELLITCVRRPFENVSGTPTPEWDFTTIDRLFSDLYGTNAQGPRHGNFRNLGIYVMSGSNPS